MLPMCMTVFGLVGPNLLSLTRNGHMGTLRRGTSLSIMQADPPHTVLVPIASGSEEIETSCITDTLVRAGAAVTVASVMPGTSLEVVMSRGLKIVADCSITECVGKKWSCIALPGGMPGAEHLRDSEPLQKLLSAQASAGGLIAAICASPAVVLATHGLCPSAATCYPAPAFRDALPSQWLEDKVTLEANVITSQGIAACTILVLSTRQHLCR